MTTFHLIRHGAHGLLGRVLTGRMPGVALDAQGRAQAAGLASALAGRPIAAVVSGPLQRARETAEPIAARLGLAVRVEPGVDDIEFGAWTGAEFAALDGDPAWRAWNAHRSTAPTPGGETMLAVQARALAAVLRLHREHAGAELAVVSHADVVKAVLAHFLGVPLDLMHRIEVSPGSRSVLTLFDEGARIEAVNLPPP